MKVDGGYKSLIQGVSQQPPKNRVSGQCSLQENCSSNPVDGLNRRYPTDFIAVLQNTLTPEQIQTAQYYDFTISGNDFLLVAIPGDVLIYDILGNLKNVDIDLVSKAYLDGSKLSMTTVSNATYIANTKTVVKMLPDSKEFAPQATILHLVGGQYGRAYTVTVTWNGGASSSTFHYTTPNGASAAQTPHVATDWIAEQLETNFNANGTLTAVFSITRKDDVLLINSTDTSSADFTCTSKDGDGETRLFTCNNTIVDVGNLPRYAPQGYFASVTTSGTANDVTYYLQFQVTGETISIGDGFGKNGIWTETVNKDIPYLMDLTTMPRLMVYDEVLDKFNITAGDWKGRQVGDLKNNEDLSVIGLPINCVSHFQSRLVFLAGNNFLASRTNHLNDFWIETATTELDTDGIDIFSTTKSAVFEFAIPFNRDLIIYANRAQFVLFGSTAISPKNISLVLTSDFECDLSTTPVSAGKNIFYPIQYGTFTGMREFYNEQYYDANDARPITAHCLKYLTGHARLLAASTTFDCLLTQTLTSKKTLFAYEYLWIEKVKKQASWSTWIFAYDIEYMFFRNNTVYFIMNIEDRLQLISMMLGVQNSPGINYPVMLDSRVLTDGVSVVIPNPFPVGVTPVCVQGEGCPNPGLLAEIDSIDSDNQITFKKDMLGGQIISGLKYKSRYQPTMPYVKDRDGIAITTGKLIISKFVLDLINTGYIQYTNSSKYYPDQSDFFSARILDDPDNQLGIQPIEDVKYTVPFRQDVNNAIIEFNSDSHLPFSISTLEWKGQWVQKGQRIQTPVGGQIQI